MGAPRAALGAAPRDSAGDQPHLQIALGAAGRARPAGAADRRAPTSTRSTRPAWRCTPRRSASRPEVGGGADLYRARVAQLVAKGWSFARIEDGRVVFKAEVAAASPYACQVQGVYVDPDRRGEGLAAAGMAAVVELALRDIAPVVSLYVNEHNLRRPRGLRPGRLRADAGPSPRSCSETRSCRPALPAE